MRGAETGAISVSVADLTAAYEAGSPSLRSATSSYFHGVLPDAFAEFVEAVGAGTQDLVDSGSSWTPGMEGGIWSANQRAFNESGLEVRQVVDKALSGGATLYNYALGLTASPISGATIEAMAAAFGANPALNPGRSNDVVAENRNLFSANYVYQMGLYAQAKKALVDAKAYAGDEACTAERDAAIQSFFRTWEQGLYARFTFYANKAANRMAAVTDDEARATALHDLAEGLGLALSFHGITSPASGPMKSTTRLMTDAHISAAVNALGVTVSGDLGDGFTGGFVSNTIGFFDAVRGAENVVVEAYGLNQDQLSSYWAPTDG
ncbi:MAG TPA: hypothetical protein VEY30_13600 [Myxococcaceae bacterium]|nr:hypothetical protein [Myxococcaceae bacterium]